MLETIDDIIGKRADADIVRTIKQLVTEEPEVRGAYDLFINNYGPEKNYASLHVELPDTMTVDEVDELTRRLQYKVYEKSGIILTSIGVYAYNTKDEEAARIRNKVMETVLQNDWALQVHGFNADTQAKKMRFDVVFSFDIDYDEGNRIIREQVAKIYPDYALQITSDVDIS